MDASGDGSARVHELPAEGHARAADAHLRARKAHEASAARHEEIARALRERGEDAQALIAEERAANEWIRAEKQATAYEIERAKGETDGHGA